MYVSRSKRTDSIFYNLKWSTYITLKVTKCLWTSALPTVGQARFLQVFLCWKQRDVLWRTYLQHLALLIKMTSFKKMRQNTRKKKNTEWVIFGRNNSLPYGRLSPVLHQLLAKPKNFLPYPRIDCFFFGLKWWIWKCFAWSELDNNGTMRLIAASATTPHHQIFFFLL